MSGSEPIVVAPGGGEQVEVRGSTVFLKAVAADTTGAFSFVERTLPPHGRPPTPHRHTNCHEAFYVLDGTIEFVLDGAPVQADPGTFVLVPGGVAHTFVNRTDDVARLLILHTPAMDRYFRELHDLLLQGGDIHQERALMRAFGMELVVEDDQP